MAGAAEAVRCRVGGGGRRGTAWRTLRLPCSTVVTAGAPVVCACPADGSGGCSGWAACVWRCGGCTAAVAGLGCAVVALAAPSPAAGGAAFAPAAAWPAAAGLAAAPALSKVAETAAACFAGMLWDLPPPPGSWPPAGGGAHGSAGSVRPAVGSGRALGSARGAP